MVHTEIRLNSNKQGRYAYRVNGSRAYRARNYVEWLEKHGKETVKEHVSIYVDWNKLVNDAGQDGSMLQLMQAMVTKVENYAPSAYEWIGKTIGHIKSDEKVKAAWVALKPSLLKTSTYMAELYQTDSKFYDKVGSFSKKQMVERLGSLNIKDFMRGAFQLWKKVLSGLASASHDPSKVAAKMCDLKEKLDKVNGAIELAIKYQDKKLNELPLGDMNIFSGNFVTKEMVEGALAAFSSYYEANKDEIRQKYKDIQKWLAGTPAHAPMEELLGKLKENFKGMGAGEVAEVINKALAGLGQMTVKDVLSKANEQVKDIVELVMMVKQERAY